MADRDRTPVGSENGQAEGMTLPVHPNRTLINRNYGNTLVRIGRRHFPGTMLALAFSESALLISSFLVATALRFRGFAVTQAFLANHYNWYRILLVTATCQLAFYCNDLYDLRRASRSRSALLVRLLRALGTTFLGLAILYYILPPIRLERGILALMAPLALLVIFAGRLGASSSKDFNRPVERLLILGTGNSAAGLAGEILSRPELQYKIVGFLSEGGDPIEKPLACPGIIGVVSDLDRIVQREQIDRVVISLGERRGVLPCGAMAALKLQGLPIEDAQSIYARLTGRIMLEQLRPSWLILSEGFNKSRFVLAGKRAIDISVSLFLIILTLPLMLAVAVAILMESGRPLLFRQERIGRGGSNFHILKFRSARQGSDKGDPSWTTDDDQLTLVGRFLRKSRLDELPQLVNILRGEMSLVGPRPEVPYFCHLLEKEIPFFNQRHMVRPGLTGWAQVKYRYGDSLEEAKTKFEFDLFYIRHLSLFLDLAIIFETARVVIWGRDAK